MPQSDTAGAARPIPPGMLRVSKTGEEDRVVFPVHAEGWARQGWSVHFPPQDEEPGEGGGNEPMPVPPPPEGPPLVPLPPPGDDDLGNLPAPVGDGEQEGGGAEPEGDPGAAPDFEVMTRAQIVDTTYELYGVRLNGNQTRERLIEQATQVALDAAAAPAEPAETEGGGEPSDSGADGAGDGSADFGVAVPDLGI